ncbi:hypothetical protein Cyast_0432 [Cyanobacterium stanieri PCC 7202]|uniref:DUF4340 domain-containing protein n=1 Tax=Cyanobacterium stanieri (strain ATCC 29140 / PCC 7202) TaxID=292563 RepID=K9YIV9_CYASC|nr:hypothetical protein Cyast_0432 [Cyanobacterium stanieri PCC 7202]
MKFNRSTILLSIFAVSLASIIYLLEIRPQSNVTNNDNENLVRQGDRTATLHDRIFPFDTDQVKIITIDPPQSLENSQTLVFEKTDAEVQPWQMSEPEQVRANDASISFLLNLFPQAPRQPEIPMDEANLSEYGLESPRAKITITLDNGENYKISIGGSNFDNSQIYGLVKFPESASQSEGVFLMSRSFQYAVERPYEDWKQPKNEE